MTGGLSVSVCYNNPVLSGDAILAQLVEQLTRNEQVAGSIPADGSNIFIRCFVECIYWTSDQLCGYRIAAIM
jgi:hypothetical protein